MFWKINVMDWWIVYGVTCTPMMIAGMAFSFPKKFTVLREGSFTQIKNLKQKLSNFVDK